MSDFIFGISFIVIPILFNVFFAMLAKDFDYPNILRQPASVVLKRFQSGGTRLITIWWCFMLTAVGFIPLAVSLPQLFKIQNSQLTPAITSFGLVAGLVQVIGLSRWSFVMPYLARESAKHDLLQDQSIDLMFNVLNRFLGVAIGEHLGYFFTGAWSISVGIALFHSSNVSPLIGPPGVVIGFLLTLCSLEFVGKFEEFGWNFAARLTPITYVAWSIWLITIGADLLLHTY